MRFKAGLHKWRPWGRSRQAIALVEVPDKAGTGFWKSEVWEDRHKEVLEPVGCAGNSPAPSP